MKWEENDGTFIESFFDGLETVWETISLIICFSLCLIVIFVMTTFIVLIVAICVSIWITILGG